MTSASTTNPITGTGPQVIVGIADLKVSTDPDQVLVTYSLGSCIGVTMYDPETHVGGLIHCMLPTAKQNPERGKTHPFMFVDTGVMSMITELIASVSVPSSP